MIDATTRTKLVNASTEEKVTAVYALIKGSEYYGIKGNASDQAIKALWDDAIAGKLIASQIILDADQINLAGKTIFTSQKTASLANTAQSNAEATAASQRNEMATKLGYASYDAMVTAAAQGQTIIDGGYLRTALIDVANILTKNIMVKDKGVLRSSNYNGTIDEDGNITNYGNQGWAIDHAGKSDFINIRALNAQIMGSLESENFDPNSHNSGYKFYKDGNTTRGIIPLVETYQIKSTVANKPVFFLQRGLSAVQFIKNGFDMTRYRNWNSIFGILGFYNGRETTDGYVLCNGVINGKNVQYLGIIYSQSACSMSAYGYSGSTFNNVFEEFSYNNTPTATVDIIF